MATATNLYQYYTSLGKALPSLKERAPLYEQYGLGPATSYVGSAQQNTSLLQKLIAGAPAQSAPAQSPTNPTQVQPYLDGVVTKTLQETALPQVRTSVQIAEDLKTQGLLPTTERPQAPNLLETFQTLRTEQGLDQMESQLNDLKAAEQDVLARLETQKISERGKPVALNVIEGRIGEEEQQARQDLEFIGRQKARLNDQLTTAYNMINTIMNLTDKDYQNAAADYDSKFKQNIDTINLIKGIQDSEKTDRERVEDNARANLQVWVNLLKEGSVSLASMSMDQKVMLGKLEVQAGFQPGFLASVKKDPKADIIATNSLSDGRVQIIIRNPDGTITSQIHGKAIKTKTDGASTKVGAEDVNRGLLILEEVDREAANKYGDPGLADKLISREEFGQAFTRLEGLVGAAKATETMNRAWLAGGYKKWGW